MGTTLTGTTPQDTYDSLIKVTDNGPLSGTAKYLSDGLGNDSVLALSTSAVGVSETSPLGKLHVKTADTSVSSVSAQGNLLVLEDTENGLSILSSTAGAGYILFGDSADNDVAGIVYDHSSNAMIFNTNAAERLRITSAGNVGIGTTSPNSALTIGTGLDIRISTTGNLLLGSSSQSIYKSSGADAISFNANGAERFRITANGVTFNGDTAAANALDDYEEGTWTPTFVGCTFTGSTIAKYTKIGNVVNVQLSFINQTIASASGAASITGLPFTATANGYFAGSINYADAFSTTDTSVRVGQGTNGLFFNQNTSTTDAVFNNGTSNRSLILSITYFV